MSYICPIPATDNQWAASQATSASVVASKAATDVAAKASAAYTGVTDEMVNAWDESQLREWLLEQGILSPASQPEQLRILAKNKASRISSAMFGGPTDTLKASAESAAGWGQKSAQSAASVGSKSAESAASEISKSAQSAANWGSKSASSAHSQASAAAASAYNWATGKLDDSKDYVFSKWDDSDLEDWLEVHGYVKPKPASRNALLAAVRDAYSKTVGPVYNAWDQSTIHHWLVDHHVVAPTETKRDKLLELMKENYYSDSDKVYTRWEESKMRDWLVDEGVLSKSSPELKYDKYVKLMDEHYEKSKNVAWSAWDDSSMREWLVNRGIIRSNENKKHDDLIDLMEKEYKAPRTPYLAWPDARLRSTLRSYGVDDRKINNRAGLLQEMRVHYVQSENVVTKFVNYVKQLVNDAINLVLGTIGVSQREIDQC